MRKHLIVAASIGLLVLGGCSSSPTTHFGVKGWAAHVPYWITDSEEMVARAAASPGAAICPEKIDRARKYTVHAMETYWKCNTENAMTLLNEAKKLAAEAEACVQPSSPVKRVSAGPAMLTAETLFAFDKSELSQQGKGQLDRFLYDLAAVPFDGVMIIGHADPIGSNEYNQRLSQRRAMAVANYLTRHGVPPNQIRTEGRGERELLITYDECVRRGAKGRSQIVQCLQPNRRATTTARVSNAN